MSADTPELAVSVWCTGVVRMVGSDCRSNSNVSEFAPVKPRGRFQGVPASAWRGVSTVRARGGSRRGSNESPCRSASVWAPSMTSSSERSISARSVSSSTPIAVVSTVWCGPPAVRQHSAEVDRSVTGLPNRGGHREARQQLVRRHHGDLVGYQPEPVAHVRDPEDDAGRRGGGEHQADRVFPVADGQPRNGAARHRHFFPTRRHLLGSLACGAPSPVFPIQRQPHLPGSQSSEFFPWAPRGLRLELITQRLRAPHDGRGAGLSPRWRTPR
jgi:hypothetical protein